jgi:hypothetical protein
MFRLSETGLWESFHGSSPILSSNQTLKYVKNVKFESSLEAEFEN